MAYTTQQLRAVATDAAIKAGISPQVFLAQIQAESGFNPNAKSPKGAVGIAQIIPRFHPDVDPTDPIASLYWAARFDAANLHKHGNWRDALSIYNSGGPWSQGQAKLETRNYVTKILAAAGTTAVSAKTPARGAAGGSLFPILPTPLPSSSEFRVPDAEGAPSKDGTKYHAALDWMAPAGTPVSAPVAGEIVEVKRTADTSGQVYGGVVKIRIKAGNGLDPVVVLRHVTPQADLRVGQKITQGAVVATVSPWDGGSTHAHIEYWKRLSGGYRFENMADPLELLKGDVTKTIGPEDVPKIVNDAKDKVVPDPFGWVKDAIAQVLGWLGDQAKKVGKWIGQEVVLVVAYLGLTVLAVWLVAQGAHNAFGSPAPPSPSAVAAAGLSAVKGAAA